MFAPAGFGKTTAALNFPRPYIIDTERGTENYDKQINAVGGAVYQTTDIRELVAEVKSLLTERHDFLTLVIDPITPVYQDLLDRCEEKVGSDFGRHYGAANKEMRRLVNMLMNLDMNVVITSHAKDIYGPNMQKLGATFDSWKRLDYIFDLVIELRKDAKKVRTGTVHKTRIETFPDGETFPWSWEEITQRYPTELLMKEAATVALASFEQVAELKRLLEVVRLPEGTAEKWLAKANAEDWDDMPSDVIGKCIEHVRGRLPGAPPVANMN
jgi:hypothetical protein